MIAIKTGIGTATLSRLKNSRPGETFKTSVLERLCEYFDCDVSDLIERIPESK